MTELAPLSDKIIVERQEAESETEGGIVIPDMAKEKPRRGIVKAVGPGRKLDVGGRTEMDVKVGDEVIFPVYAGTEIEVDKVLLLVMAESDVLAVVRKESRAKGKKRG